MIFDIIFKKFMLCLFSGRHKGDNENKRQGWMEVGPTQTDP
jgi:hypothetical protein